MLQSSFKSADKKGKAFWFTVLPLLDNSNFCNTEIVGTVDFKLCLQSTKVFIHRMMAHHSWLYCHKSCCWISFRSFLPSTVPCCTKWTLLMHHYNLNTRYFLHYFLISWSALSDQLCFELIKDAFGSQEKQ